MRISVSRPEGAMIVALLAANFSTLTFHACEVVELRLRLKFQGLGDGGR